MARLTTGNTAAMDNTILNAGEQYHLQAPPHLVMRNSRETTEFGVYIRKVNTEKGYLISLPVTDRSDYKIWTADPLAICDVFSRFTVATPIRTVCEFLVQRGYCIRTLARWIPREDYREGEPYTTPSRKPETPLLGHRHAKYKATVHDLNEYEARRNEICEYAWGRALVLKGGVIRRLVVSSIGERAIDISIDGPSPSAQIFGFSCELFDANGEGTGEVYVDDDVSADEEKVVIGQYQIRIRK